MDGCILQHTFNTAKPRERERERERESLQSTLDREDRNPLDREIKTERENWRVELV